MGALPPALRAAIAELTEGRGPGALRQAQDALSRRYRTGEASSGAVTREEDVLAYLAGRLPATFAAVSAALAELRAARPDFAPVSLLDAGCGPGTAMLAAIEAFPGVARAAGVDHNARFLRMASRLAAAAGYGRGRAIHFQTGDMRADFAAETADLVLAAYALVESGEGKAASLALRLWDLSGDVLVLVEPGSRPGFARLRAARSALIGRGATILAPCTHGEACPIVDPDWCHFSVRLARSRLHRAAKGASVPFEDEKFAYLIAARSGSPAGTSRIVAPVLHGKAGHRLRLCHAGRIEETIIGPRDPRFKAAKKWAWGDAAGDQTPTP